MHKRHANRRVGALPVVWLVGVASLACGRPADRPASTGQLETPSWPGRTTEVFTPARPTLTRAVRDFFGLLPRAEQPIAFRHDVHAEQGLTCTDFCHDSVSTGPVAGLPSVTLCMFCHGSVATDRPVIQEVAGYAERGEDIPWQRVYGYPAPAHVRFHHAAHIGAGIECATCHGDVAQQTVAERVMDLDMGFCVSCHRERQASTDCLTCHY